MRGGKGGLFAAAVLVHLVVVYAPQAPGAPSALPVDKVVHVLVFALVVATGRWAGLPAWVLIPSVAAHAPISEIVQSLWLPNRSGDLWDVVADLTGVGLGAVAHPRPTRRRRRPSRAGEAS